MKYFISILILFFSPFANLPATAQLNLPKDEKLNKTAQSQYALFSDYYRTGDFEEAKKPLKWLLQYTPKIHENIYINGIKLYQEIGEKESNPVYEDSVLTLYDLRIKYFNNEKDLIDRKASAAYKYYRLRSNKEEPLFEIFDRTYELNGKNVGTNNLAIYMDVTRRYNKKYPLQNEQILDRYYRVLDAIDYKEQQGGESETYEKIRAVATKILLEIIPIDCDFIKNQLVPRIEKDKDMIKRVVSLSLSEGCTKEPYFIEVAKLYSKENPNPVIFEFLGNKEFENGNDGEGMKYYNLAIQSARDQEKKASLYYQIALRMVQQGKISDARNYAEKALGADPNYKRAYKLIGDLYFNSYADCKQEKSRVADRAVYWVAYDMYQKAGDTEAMKNAAQQFPSIDDIFNEDRKEGSSYQVNCWINKSTMIRRRKEE